MPSCESRSDTEKISQAWGCVDKSVCLMSGVKPWSADMVLWLHWLHPLTQGSARSQVCVKRVEALPSCIWHVAARRAGM
jgi:hypothetical protein